MHPFIHSIHRTAEEWDPLCAFLHVNPQRLLSPGGGALLPSLDPAAAMTALADVSPHSS